MVKIDSFTMTDMDILSDIKFSFVIDNNEYVLEFFCSDCGSSSVHSKLINKSATMIYNYIIAEDNSSNKIYCNSILFNDSPDSINIELEKMVNSINETISKQSKKINVMNMVSIISNTILQVKKGGR